jgi:hypothetical protein
VDLDAKVIGLFAAASVVIGLTTLGSIGRGTGGLNSWVTGFLIAAVVAYAGSAAATLRVLWPAEHWRSLHADELWSAGKAKPIAEIQTFLLNSIEQAYGSNKRLLKRKANAAFWVGIAVAAEIVCIGVALILTRF